MSAERITSGPLFLFLATLLFLLITCQAADAQSAPDTDPPQLTIRYPEDWFGGQSTVIDVGYSDATSGVDTDTLAVILDGNDITAACNVFPDRVWCSTGPLEPGMHTMEVSISDYAGNRDTVTKEFGRDPTPPVVTSVTPNGWVNTSDPVVTVTVTDPQAGIIASSLWLSLGQNSTPPIEGCTITAYSSVSAGISCPMSGLADGIYEFSFHAETPAWSTSWNLGSILKIDTQAPVVSGITPSGPIGPGDLTVEADVSDSGSGVAAASVQVFLDGLILTDCVQAAGHVSCPAGQPAGGAHAIVVTAVDNVGWTSSATGSFEVESNRPPVVAAGGDLIVTEGDTALGEITASDPDGDTLTVTSSVGAITDNGDGTWSWSMAANDGPADSQTVTVAVDDGRGGTASAAFNLTVGNVSPGAGAIAAPIDPQLLGTAIETSVLFSDPGPLDTHTAYWEWGDGSGTTGTVSEVGGSGTVAGSHLYEAAGVYTVTVTVIDRDGGAAQSSLHYVVIYDPSAGFVTGGGWIDSPAGAYLTDPTLTGKANFGFVSRYKKGASVPGGQTEFNFRAGDLDFHSTSYDWMVIAGHKAMYKGTGTINGAGDYRFMLSAIDGDTNGNNPDRFRIRIWDDVTGAVVYDNQRGAVDDADPATAIGGGSIVIHRD